MSMSHKDIAVRLLGAGSGDDFQTRTPATGLFSHTGAEKENPPSTSPLSCTGSDA